MRCEILIRKFLIFTDQLLNNISHLTLKKKKKDALGTIFTEKNKIKFNFRIH